MDASCQPSWRRSWVSTFVCAAVRGGPNAEDGEEKIFSYRVVAGSFTNPRVKLSKKTIGVIWNSFGFEEERNRSCASPHPGPSPGEGELSSVASELFAAFPGPSCPMPG